MVKSIPQYVVISPARNEENFILKTFEALKSQSVRPVEWVLVNDGSTDSTGALIDTFASQETWIKAVHREDRGFRKPGGGVAETFYSGLEALENKNWDFIVKLDCDLSFEADYFENCLKMFAKDERLGIGGGTIVSYREGGTVKEEGPRFHVRGATKIYRKECWEDIGGFIIEVGWDTMDEVKAQMLGWSTYSFEDIILTQLRITGASTGIVRDAFKNGLGCYVCGYHPLFMLAKCLRRLQKKPYIVGSCGQLAGFIYGYLSGKKQIPNRELIGYLREQQMRRLMLRKSIWV